MNLKLHKLARTTPAIRKEIQTSTLTYKELREKYGISYDTIYKWRKRKDTQDRSHTRHNLLSKIDQTGEILIKELRESLELSLDDITEVMRRCIDKTLSRGAVYRCLKRLGLSKRPQKAGEDSPQRFDPESRPGYIHMDVKYLTKLQKKRTYVYAAIDRATRYVYVEGPGNVNKNVFFRKI